MKFNYNDGGRSKYFKADKVGDCVTRAIAIATGRDYKEVYDRLNEMAKSESTKKHRGHKRSQSRNGVFKETWKRYLKEIGWVHHKTCELGSSKSKLRFVDGALPNGTLIVQLSKHLTCLIDGVINDTYDCSKKEYYDWYSGDLMTNDERCVYGYWTAPTEEEKKMQDETNAMVQEYKDFVAKEKADLKAKKEEVRKHNESVKKKYAKKLNKARRELRKLEREMQKEMLEMPKAERNTWAKRFVL